MELRENYFFICTMDWYWFVSDQFELINLIYFCLFIFLSVFYLYVIVYFRYSIYLDIGKINTMLLYKISFETDFVQIMIKQ